MFYREAEDKYGLAQALDTLGMHPAFWLGLQADHDLRVAEWKRGREIVEQVEPLTRTG